MQTLDDMPRYALVQHSLPKASIEHITLTEEQRQELWEEFRDENDPDTQEMADFLNLGDNRSDVTMYDEKPDGWPEQ